MPYDPVCGKKVGTDVKWEYNGKEYFFCSEECKAEFMKNPEKYVITKQDGNAC